MTCDEALDLMTIIALLAAGVGTGAALMTIDLTHRWSRLVSKQHSSLVELRDIAFDLDQKLHKAQVELEAWKENEHA